MPLFLCLCFFLSVFYPPSNLSKSDSQALHQNKTVIISLKFLSPTNAPLYYTYKMLKYTVKICHDCSYMFRSIWTIIREPMPNLAKVTVLWRYSVKIRRQMFSNVGKKCFRLLCVLCAVQFVTVTS